MTVKCSTHSKDKLTEEHPIFPHDINSPLSSAAREDASITCSRFSFATPGGAALRRRRGFALQDRRKAWLWWGGSSGLGEASSRPLSWPTPATQPFPAHQVPQLLGLELVWSAPPWGLPARPYDTSCPWYSTGSRGAHLPHLNTNQGNPYAGRGVFNRNHGPVWVCCSGSSATPRLPQNLLAGHLLSYKDRWSTIWVEKWVGLGPFFITGNLNHLKGSKEMKGACPAGSLHAALPSTEVQLSPAI